MHNIKPIKRWRDFDQVRRIHNNQKQATPHRPKTMQIIPHFLLWLRWRYRRVPLLVYVGHEGNSYGWISYQDHGGNPFVEVGVMKRFKGTAMEREMWDMMTSNARPRPAYACVRDDDSFIRTTLNELGWTGGWYSDGEGYHTLSMIRNDG